MWLAYGELCFQIIQSVLLCRRNLCIFSWSSCFISLWNRFLALTKLVPLSHLIILTEPIRAMNRRKDCMKESVSIEFTLSMCIARHDKHVKISPYFFNIDRRSLMWNGANKSAPQYVNTGKPDIFCLPCLPLRSRHLTLFQKMLRTSALIWMMQYPPLRTSLIYVICHSYFVENDKCLRDTVLWAAH